MSTDTSLQPQSQSNVPAVSQPRLPYHPGLKERFGIDQTEWRALVESTFPAARSVGAVILALAYCKARNLDPFKKTVHIVPIWDKARGCEVETVWPGIAEYRTTASRTACYAGHDEVVHGPMLDDKWGDVDRKGKKYGEVAVAFPEWSQMTVYRIVNGERCAFPGPKVYWLETYASKKGGCPNSMWAKRPFGMIDKCAEAAALRGAFPEELGGEPTYEEWGGFRWHGRDAIDVDTEAPAQLEAPTKSANLAESLKATQQKTVDQSEPEKPEAGTPTDKPDRDGQAEGHADAAADEARQLDEYRTLIGETTTLKDVDALEKGAMEGTLSPRAKQQISTWCDERRAVIREGNP